MVFNDKEYVIKNFCIYLVWILVGWYICVKMRSGYYVIKVKCWGFLDIF